MKFLDAEGVRQFKEYKTVKCIIDLKPALSVEQLDERLIREFKEGNLKNINNVKTNSEIQNIISTK